MTKLVRIMGTLSGLAGSLWACYLGLYLIYSFNMSDIDYLDFFSYYLLLKEACYLVLISGFVGLGGLGLQRCDTATPVLIGSILLVLAGLALIVSCCIFNHLVGSYYDLVGSYSGTGYSGEDFLLKTVIVFVIPAALCFLGAAIGFYRFVSARKGVANG